MMLEDVLFFLRLIGAMLLLGVLLGIFVVIWREYQVIAQKMSQQVRVHGQLRALKRLDDLLVENGEVHPMYAITTIGRAQTNTIVLENHFASGEHASLTLRDGQWWLEDRGSRNGTHLNDEKITIPTIVTEGDLISIGDDYFKIVFTGKP